MLLRRKRIGIRARARARAKRAVGRAVGGLDARLPLAEAGKEFLRKAFPDHWSFLLGELALYSFIVLVVTGSFLTFFFEPTRAETIYHGSYVPLSGVPMSRAYASVVDISFEVRGGLLIRQIHHWAALFFLASIGLHLLRIFFTGAFRRPREFNWMIGVTMFGIAMLEGFTGYSLPDDLLSGTGLRTAQGILLSVPVVGTYASFLIFGGEYPGDDIVFRFYSWHILFLPGLLIALITAHLFLVVKLKHTQWAEPGRTNRNVVGAPMVPQYTAKSAGLFFMLFGTLAAFGALMQINPVWSFGPYRPNKVSIGSQPDWYVGFLEGGLRLMPAAETVLGGHTLAWDVFLPGVLMPLTMFAVLYTFPLFERWVSGDRREHHLCDRPRNQPTRTALGVAAVMWYAVLLFTGGQDIHSFVFRLPLNALAIAFRISFFLLPVLAFWLTRRLCLGLQAHDRARLLEGEEEDEVRLSDEGSYEQRSRPLPGSAKHLLISRSTPRPGSAGDPLSARRRHRLRRKLNVWYYGKRVELPVTEEEFRQHAAIVADPTEDGK